MKDVNFYLQKKEKTLFKKLIGTIREMKIKRTGSGVVNCCTRKDAETTVCHSARKILFASINFSKKNRRESVENWHPAFPNFVLRNLCTCFSFVAKQKQNNVLCFIRIMFAKQLFRE